MESVTLAHRWQVSPREAMRIQLELRERLQRTPPAGFSPISIAGADVSVTRHGRIGYAGIAVLDARTLEVREEVTAVVKLGFPYVPGLLSFRELPPLAAAWEKLRERPDVLIFDGHGYAHPRRFGLACHGGVLFDVPSIGCAKSRLIGEHGGLSPARGATTDLLHEGEVIGRLLRTRANVQPLYVSIGHRMDLDTAVRVVLEASPRFREPETTRRAHRLVNRLSAEAEGSR